MIDINTKTKNLYKSDSVDKTWFIAFPDLQISFDDSVIIGESAELFESAMEGEDIQFVGCIAARFSVTLRISTENANVLKNQHIIVSLVPNDTQVDSIVVFNGYVDSVEIESNKRNKTITAYDKLYALSQLDVADWYKTFQYPATLKQFRDGLFSQVGITQELITLPLDDFSIGRMYDPDKVAALDLIKQLCQANCVFGRMNRNGNFEYVVPVSGSTEGVDYYREASYQEYTVKPVDKLTVKFGEVEGSYGTGENEYVIQNNIFMNGHTAATLKSVAQAVYPHVNNFSFAPFDMNLNGLPYVQCLDRIQTTVLNVDDPDHEVWENKSFLVLSRTMSGMQALKDNASAQGSEDIHKFVSDLNINMDALEQVVDQIIEDIDNSKLRFFLLTNGQAIDVQNNNRSMIIDLYFAAKKNTTVILQVEAICQVDTLQSGYTYSDTQLKAIYEVDGLEINDYNPTQQWLDGKHLLHLFKTFIVQSENLMKHLRVFLEATGGNVLVPIGNMKAALYGQNLIAEDEWNGIIEIDEQLSVVNIPGILMNVAVEDLDFDVQVPIPIDSTDTQTQITIPLPVFDGGISDEVEVEEGE